MALVAFASWRDVLAHAHAGLSLYYQAPLDLEPTRLQAVLPHGGRVPFTYEARPRSIRIFPPGCIGRGAMRTSDPFTADASHLSRFSREVD